MDAESYKHLFLCTLLLVGVLLLIVSVVDAIKDKHKDKKTGKKWKIILVVLPSLLLFFLSVLVNIYPEKVLEFPKPISFIIGLSMTQALGSLLQRLLDFAVKDIGLDRHPTGIFKEQWDGLTRIPEGGIITGLLERTLFFIALWYEKPIYIGGLLTFKVATKWEAWKNIVQVPEQKPNGFPDDLSYFIFKRKLGSKHLNQFLIGTFSNILFALVGYGFYIWCWKVFDP